MNPAAVRRLAATIELRLPVGTGQDLLAALVAETEAGARGPAEHAAAVERLLALVLEHLARRPGLYDLPGLREIEGLPPDPRPRATASVEDPLLATLRAVNPAEAEWLVGARERLATRLRAQGLDAAAEARGQEALRPATTTATVGAVPPAPAAPPVRTTLFDDTTPEPAAAARGRRGRR